MSANIHRRHMTKGQRAMTVAKIYPEPERGGRGKKATVSVENVSPQRVSYARSILRYAPDLADNVLRGSASLDDAYKRTLVLTDNASRWLGRGPQRQTALGSFRPQSRSSPHQSCVAY